MTANGDLPFEFEVLPFKHMIVDEYQRPLSTFVEKVIREFEPALVGTLTVSKRSATRYALIDGQTRVEGMKELGHTEWACLVYTDLTREQEAAMFAKLVTERRGIQAGDRFKAQVIAGEPVAVEIDEIVRSEGFEIGQIHAAPNAIAAAASLEFAYWGASGATVRRTATPELLRRTLQAIKACWPRLPDTARGQMIIKGMALFLREVDADMDKLAANVGKLQPSELGKRATALKEGKGVTSNSPAFMAEVIENQYRRSAAPSAR